MIETACPACGHVLRTRREELLGRSVNCPRCRAPMVLGGEPPAGGAGGFDRTAALALGASVLGVAILVGIGWLLLGGTDAPPPSPEPEPAAAAPDPEPASPPPPPEPIPPGGSTDDLRRLDPVVAVCLADGRGPVRAAYLSDSLVTRSGMHPPFARRAAEGQGYLILIFDEPFASPEALLRYAPVSEGGGASGSFEGVTATPIVTGEGALDVAATRFEALGEVRSIAAAAYLVRHLPIAFEIKEHLRETGEAAPPGNVLTWPATGPELGLSEPDPALVAARTEAAPGSADTGTGAEDRTAPAAPAAESDEDPPVEATTRPPGTSEDLSRFAPRVAVARASGGPVAWACLSDSVIWVENGTPQVQWCGDGRRYLVVLLRGSIRSGFHVGRYLPTGAAKGPRASMFVADPVLEDGAVDLAATHFRPAGGMEGIRAVVHLVDFVPEGWGTDFVPPTRGDEPKPPSGISTLRFEESAEELGLDGRRDRRRPIHD